MNTENIETLNIDEGKNKVLTLGSLPIIKHDILHIVEEWDKGVYDSIKDEYQKELYKKVNEIYGDFENSSLEDKLELLDKIAQIQDEQSTAKEAINSLKQSVIRLEGGVDEDGNPGSVLDPDEVRLILKAALIDSTFIGDNIIGSETVLGKQIVGLVGLFGTVKASNISGDVIQGKTVQSADNTTLVNGTEYETFDSESNKLGVTTSNGSDLGPSWQLREDGDGYLAGGKISWDKEGNVVYKDLNIKFSDIEDAENNIGEIIEAINNGLTVKDLIDSWTADSKLSPSEIQQLEKLISDINLEFERTNENVNILVQKLTDFVVEDSEDEELQAKAEELRAKIAENIALLDLVSYVESKDLAIDTINYYLGKERDEYGCILIEETDEYSLDNINLYYDTLNIILENYESVKIFYAELTGELSALKIYNVNKILNGLEEDYKELEELTKKNTEITDAIVNGWIDDNLISAEEQNSLKLKLEEISNEFTQICNYVNTALEIFTEMKSNSGFTEIFDTITEYEKNLNTNLNKYKESFNKVKETIEYYLYTAEKDEVGNAALNADYDISYLTTFYKDREDILNAYYEANAYYTTFNRFGSKTLWIGEDGLYAGTISADNFRGWNIEGLTIGSGKSTILPDDVIWGEYNENASSASEAFIPNKGGMGPSWQLREDGDGHIAGGQISWDANGKVTLGKNVTISYSQIPDADENIDPKIDNKITALRTELLDKINSGESITQDDLDKLELSLNLKYSNDLTNLYNQLHADDDANKEAIRNKIDAIENEQKEVNGAVDVIKATLQIIQGGGTDADGDGKPDTVLNEEDIKEIMAAALVEESFWTDDMIGSKTVMGQRIIGLVGKFGTVKASNIQGDLIEGMTMQTAVDIKLKEGTKYYEFGAEDEYGNVSSKELTANGTTSKGPAWQLRKDGSGYIGAGGFSWDKNGNVELKGVTLDWSAIKDAVEGNFEIPDVDIEGNIEPSKFKSIIFKRTKDTETIPDPPGQSEGTWDYPVPDGWEDGIPEGTGPVWMTSRIIRSDNKHTWGDVNFKTEWTAPKLMVDNETFEVAYGTQEVENYFPISLGLPKNSGLANPEGSFTKGWTDEPVEGVEYYYMATAEGDNGNWSTWTVSKIKGEDGRDGTSIKVSGSYDTWEDFVEKGPWKGGEPDDHSLCYVIAGDLYVWADENNEWANVGPFKGDKGDAGETYFLYIKYAKTANVDATGTAEAGSIELTGGLGEETEGAKWMGIGHGTSPEDPDPLTNIGIYKWSRIGTEPIVVPARFKSIAFTRIPVGVDISGITPTGGTWTEPWPDAKTISGTEIKWHDGIPEGEGGIIWSTSRTFIANEVLDDGTVGSIQNNTTWEKPKVMVDSETFETAYGTSKVLKADGTIDESGLPTKDGKENEAARPGDKDAYDNAKGWYDEPEDIPEEEGGAIYMATATCSGGEWSPWHIVKIKGEKGDKGAGIKLSGTKDTIYDLPIPPESYDEAYIVKTNPADISDKQWNHLFVWTGEDPDSSTVDDGHYKGWSDTGQFNGKDGANGKDGVNAYVYIKYADHIEFNELNEIVPDKCVLAPNDGESKGRWLGLGNGSEEDEPVLKEGAAGYVADNWKKYKWTDLASNVDERVTTFLGTWHISSNHIAGKIMDNAVTKEGDENYTQLEPGTKYVIFERDDETGEEIAQAEQTAVEGSEGPSWQIRDDGTGYFAAGKIRWTNTGKLTANFDGNLSSPNGGTMGEPDAEGTYPMEWDKDNIYINRNLKLGENVKIDWDKVNSPEGLATEDYVSTQITKNKVTSETIEGTYLQGKTIKSTINIDGTEDPTWIINNDGSGWLASKKIKFSTTDPILEIDGNAIMDGIENDTSEGGAKERFETLVAEKIEATDIITDTLCTRGNIEEPDSGAIYIKDNDVVVYNNDSYKEVLRISGKDYGELPENTELYDNSVDVISNSGNAEGTVTILTNDVIKDGYEYNLYQSFDKVNSDIYIKPNVIIKNPTQYTVTVNVNFSKASVYCNGTVYASSSVGNISKNVTLTPGERVSISIGLLSDSAYQKLKLPKYINDLSKGSLYFNALVLCQITSHDAPVGVYPDNVTIESIGYDVDYGYYYVPTLDRVDISATGFRKIINPYRYFIINPDNTFKVKCDSTTFEINEDGVFVNGNKIG